MPASIATTSTTPNSPDVTYHRRPLPAPAVPFNSPEGRRLFRESMTGGYMEGYFPLAEAFATQSHPAFCGLGSLAMALNALLVDPHRVWQGVWRWFDERLLDCCESLAIVEQQGVTMSKLCCLARCNGANATCYYGNDVSLEQFRADIRRVCSERPAECDGYIEGGAHEVLLVAYSRKTMNQTGDGHFSPVGGYHEGDDKVLVLDVARFKYPPHWVPLSQLYEAMLPLDSVSGKSRGYMLLRASKDADGHGVCTTHCESGCASTTKNDSCCAQDDQKKQAAAVAATVNSIMTHECDHCRPSSLQPVV